MTMEDVDRLLKSLPDYERRCDIVDRRYPDYVKTHPRQWVALAEGDVWVLADSLEELIAKLDAQGLRRGSEVIRYLNPDPVKLVL